MKLKNFLSAVIALLIAISATFLFYKNFIYKQPTLPYTTQHPERRVIQKQIDTLGKIHIAEKIKIGSLVTGTLKKLYVEENDEVKKGQLLAEIETGKDDSDVREELGNLQKAKAQFHYQKAYYTRQKQLFLSGQLSKNEFDQIEQTLLALEGDVTAAKARYDRAKLAYDNAKIYSPQDGVITNIGITEGERVTTDLNATILFEIAKDTSKMEGSLEIDESNVGYIKKGQKVKFTVDTLPNEVFKTSIKQISYSPKQRNDICYYKAIISIDNSSNRFRPGLSINAKISIAKTKSALALSSQAFMISSKVLTEIAKNLGFSIHPIDKKELKKIERSSANQAQTVWVVLGNGKQKTFVQKIVTTNITDDVYFEITSGLSETDDVIVELEESDYMEEVYKRAFKNRM
jgi:HlyD family secretion protein